MTDFFANMDSDYARKHFPNGVFESAMKTIRRRSVVFMFFMGLFFAGSLYGLFWSIGRTMELSAEGRDDMMGVCMVICGFFGVAALVTGLLLVILLRSTRKKRGDYIAAAAKNSRLPENEIEAFEQQSVAPDCYILRLTAGLDRLLSSGTNKDGLLTKDYIYLADASQIVMRVDQLKACCFYEYSYYVNTGKTSKKILCLAILLVASNGVSVFSDTTEQAGKALMALLKERNSGIDLNGGKVVPEGALEAYKKRVLETLISH